jgi:hypothetical protein
MPQTQIRHQLTIACLETLRLFEKIRDSSQSKIVVNRIESRMNELNGILNLLEQDVATEALKALAVRIGQMHNEIMDDTKE